MQTSDFQTAEEEDSVPGELPLTGGAETPEVARVQTLVVYYPQALSWQLSYGLQCFQVNLMEFSRDDHQCRMHSRPSP